MRTKRVVFNFFVVIVFLLFFFTVTESRSQRRRVECAHKACSKPGGKLSATVWDKNIYAMRQSQSFLVSPFVALNMNWQRRILG